MQHCKIVMIRLWNRGLSPEAQLLIIHSFECHHLRLAVLDGLVRSSLFAGDSAAVKVRTKPCPLSWLPAFAPVGHLLDHPCDSATAPAAYTRICRPAGKTVDIVLVPQLSLLQCPTRSALPHPVEPHSHGNVRKRATLLLVRGGSQERTGF